jgi:hypothetical protein
MPMTPGNRMRAGKGGKTICSLVAALYLVKSISERCGSAEVRLFEGFVSFKKKGTRRNHLRDVEILRDAVFNQAAFPGTIVEPKALRMADSDILKSAFLVAGIHTGIPPVIVPKG